MKIIIDTEKDNIPKIISMLKRYIGDNSVNTSSTQQTSAEIPSDGSMFDMFGGTTNDKPNPPTEIYSKEEDPLEKIDIIQY